MIERMVSTLAEFDGGDAGQGRDDAVNLPLGPSGDPDAVVMGTGARAWSRAKAAGAQSTRAPSERAGREQEARTGIEVIRNGPIGWHIG